MHGLKWNLPQSTCTYAGSDIILIIFLLLSINPHPLQRVAGGHLQPVLADKNRQVGQVFTLLKEWAHTDGQQNTTRAISNKPNTHVFRLCYARDHEGLCLCMKATHRPWPAWESNPHFSLLHHSLHCFTWSWFVQQTPEQNDCKVELSSHLVFQSKSKKNWSCEGDSEKGFLPFQSH